MIFDKALKEKQESIEDRRISLEIECPNCNNQFIFIAFDWHDRLKSLKCSQCKSGYDEKQKLKIILNLFDCLDWQKFDVVEDREGDS